MNQLEQLAKESQRFTVAKLEAVYKAALASTESEVEKIRDKTEMFRLYCKSNTAYGDLQNLGLEIKARADRRMGKLLSALKRRPGTRTDRTSYQNVSGSEEGRGEDRDRETGSERTPLAQVLADLHMGPMEAWRWQQQFP